MYPGARTSLFVVCRWAVALIMRAGLSAALDVLCMSLDMNTADWTFAACPTVFRFVMSSLPIFLKSVRRRLQWRMVKLSTMIQDCTLPPHTTYPRCPSTTSHMLPALCQRLRVQLEWLHAERSAADGGMADTSAGPCLGICTLVDCWALGLRHRTTSS